LEASGESVGFPVPPGIPEDIPVVGRGRGGRGEFSEDGYPIGEGYKRVRRPYDLRDPHAFAVEITGESMAPRYEQGDIVVCSPEKRWKSGDYCVVNEPFLTTQVRETSVFLIREPEEKRCTPSHLERRANN
jgi:phage repressor protein C with HTH and peptisase S24 domain